VPDEPRADLFRPAAVAAHRAASTSLATLPSPRRMTSVAFWAVAAAVAILVVAAFSVHVDETSAGAWIAGPETGAATVALPIGVLDRLRTGQSVGLRGNGPGVLDTTVVALLSPVSGADARAQFGDRLPATLRTANAVALVEVRPARFLTPVGGGRATVHLGRRSLIAELVPALRHEGPRG
jgi:hypothetical protein